MSMRSNEALRKAIAKYDAIVKGVEFTSYAYWQVTFSVAPAVDLAVLVCDNTLSGERAIEQAVVTLRYTTGQRVKGFE